MATDGAESLGATLNPPDIPETIIPDTRTKRESILGTKNVIIVQTLTYLIACFPCFIGVGLALLCSWGWKHRKDMNWLHHHETKRQASMTSAASAKEGGMVQLVEGATSDSQV